MVYHRHLRSLRQWPMQWNGAYLKRVLNTSSTTWMILQWWALLTRKHVLKQLAPDKEGGPSAILTLLGIIIDTLKGELRLPADKLQRLVSEWVNRKSCTRKDLESLVGTLQDAAKVIPSGRSFVRRAINLLSTAKRQHHFIRLSAQFRADMLWWKLFAANWNGASLLINSNSTEVLLTSDASGLWGCGAWQGNQWFQVEWNEHSRHLDISVKELIPILIAAVVWGKDWLGCRAVARCDNAAVVAVLNSRSCKDPTLMQLLRSLFFIEAKGQFKLSAIHIPGTHNDLADDLSRDRVAVFRAKKPEADPHPTVIPISLLQWLLRRDLEWTSPVWMRLFSSFVNTA